jgi:hypothetical protein
MVLKIKNVTKVIEKITLKLSLKFMYELKQISKIIKAAERKNNVD